MKLKEYLHHLNQLAKDYPELNDVEVVTSADDEGNYFTPVCFSPSRGRYEDREYTPVEDKEFQGQVNAVCLN